MKGNRIAAAITGGMLALACACASAQWGGRLPDPVQFGTRIEMGDIGQAREWLERGLDPDFVGDRIGTGLMIAAWEGNLPLMQLFVAHGANVNKTNALGETAVMHAAWRGRLEAVRWLLEHGARIEGEPRQWTALHYAAYAGHEAVARHLLGRGANINARSTNGSSPLMAAVYEGREAMVKPVPETRPTTIEGWTVREVRGEAIILQGPDGVRKVMRGDTVPGVGRIDSVVRWGSHWIVATTSGLIATP